MNEIVKSSALADRSKLSRGHALVAAGIGDALKGLYDPVLQATLPHRFGRTLGWLYFVTSGHGTVRTDYTRRG